MLFWVVCVGGFVFVVVQIWFVIYWMFDLLILFILGLIFVYIFYFIVCVVEGKFKFGCTVGIVVIGLVVFFG